MATVNVTLQQAVLLALSGLATAQYAGEVAQSGNWDTVAKASAPDKTTADVTIVDALRRQYVFDYCGACGIKVAIAKDRVILANPDIATLTEADKFDDAKRRARSAFGMGIARAWTRCGIKEPAKQNSGGRKAAPAASVQPAGATESTTMLPPSFRAKVIDLQARMVAFQSTAKLTRNDKEACGKMAELIGSIVADLDAKPVAPPAAPKSEAPKPAPTVGAALQTA